MTRTDELHEELSRSGPVKTSSNRGFGIVFAVVFVVVALWPLMGGAGPRLWSLAVAALFLAAAFLRPRWLAPLNRLWTRCGLALHALVSPLVMGLLYYSTVTPTGLVMRALGKDVLNLRRDPAATSYWIVRDPPGPEPETMKRQF